jgi:hypothetical protein
MEKSKIFIILNTFIRSKILACMVSLFVLFGSINLLNFEGQKQSIMESVEVSTTVAFSQIFSISTFSVKLISRLFVDVDSMKETTNTEESVLISDKVKDEGEESSTNEDNSSKASIGYSIASDIAVISEEIEDEEIKNLAVAGEIRRIKFIEYLKNITNISNRKEINIIYLMMLLLAILLSRMKNIGDNNIIKNKIKIKK